MKTRFLSCLLLTATFCSAQRQPAIDTNTDILHYSFTLMLNDNNDSIRCSAVIKLRALKNIKGTHFDLISLKNSGKGMKVIRVADESSGQAFSYTHAGDKLVIQFPAALPPGTEKKILVRYGGIPDNGLIISKNKFGQRTFFSDNWPNRARNWLVCKDHPSDKAAVEFIVTAPSHYQVVSNGMLTEETNLNSEYTLSHWKETVDLPVKSIGLGVAEFAVHYSGSVNDIPVSEWLYPGDKEKGFEDYGLAVQILPFFIKNIGPYAYGKLANVQSKTLFGGMENAGTIFYSEHSLTGKRNMEELIAHEIVHQWFGNMATEADWSHLWLSEGFARYLSFLYLENKYGADTLTRLMDQSRKKIFRWYTQSKKPVVDSASADYMDLLNANTYEKGAWVLHMLRKQLGDSVWWTGIRKYYAAYAGKNAVTNDFRKIMEEVSGKDLQQFFHQWLHTPGHPILQLTRSFDSAAKMLTLKITQLQPDLFQFPLAVFINSEDGAITKSFRVINRETSVQIPVEKEVQDITIDKNNTVLFELR